MLHYLFPLWQLKTKLLEFPFCEPAVSSVTWYVGSIDELTPAILTKSDTVCCRGKLPIEFFAWKCGNKFRNVFFHLRISSCLFVVYWHASVSASKSFCFIINYWHVEVLINWPSYGVKWTDKEQMQYTSNHRCVWNRKWK